MARSKTHMPTSHCDSVKGANGDELIQRLAETRPKFQSDEEEQVNDHGPFSTVPICENAEDQGADRAEHQGHGDTLKEVSILLLGSPFGSYPGHGLVSGVEFGGNFRDTERDGEEIECIPGPAEEANDEHKPLVQGQFAQDGKRTPEFDLFDRVRSWGIEQGSAGKPMGGNVTMLPWEVQDW